MGAKLLVTVLGVSAFIAVGCGSGSEDVGQGNEETPPIEFTWQKGTAPDTGTVKWATVPTGTDLGDACDALQDEWPSGTEDMGVTIVSGDERVVCAEVVR